MKLKLKNSNLLLAFAMPIILSACIQDRNGGKVLEDARLERSKSKCIQIKSLPLKIKTPGRWCLAQDIQYVGDKPEAISVEANAVTIDLSGHKITGDNNPQSDTFGIYASGVNDLIIKNGSINGFHYGIRIENEGPSSEGRSKDILITNINLDNNRFRGIAIIATRAKIYKSNINNVGGTLLYPDASPVGIEITSENCDIIGNNIANINPTGVGFAAGILLANQNNGCLINKNNITNSQFPLYGRSLGVYNPVPLMDISIKQNNIAGFTFPFMAASGKIHNNNFSNNACGIKDAPKYYGKFQGDAPNNYDDKLQCVESIEYLSKRNDVKDPRVQYRIALTYHDNLLFANPPKEGDFSNMEKAAVHYREAAKGGVSEAIRILPDFEKNLRVLKRAANTK